MKEEEAYGPKELRETKLDNDEEKVEDKEGKCYDIGESFQDHSWSQQFEAIVKVWHNLRIESSLGCA